MAHLSLFFLGSPQIDLDGIQLRPKNRRAIALLAYLAIKEGRQSRDWLANFFWPDYDQTRARGLLRRNLSALKGALAGDWLEIDRETVSLNPDAHIDVDVTRFHNLLTEWRGHGHPESEVCPSCLGPLTEALELYRGDFLAGFTLSGSLDFDDWQFFQAQELNHHLSSALEKLVRYQSERGELDPAIRYCRRWLSLDRLNEPAHYQLMQLYAYSGQHTAALRQYEECVEVLGSQSGLPPGESTTQFYEVIKENRIPTHLLRQGIGPLEKVKEDKALSPTPLEENRIVTVLNVEMAGSATAMEKNRLEDEASTVNLLLKSIEDVLTKYGGEIDRLLGEGVLVVFGRERTGETDPELAIRTGMEILKEAEKLGFMVKGGVNTGPVYFARTGSEGNRESAAMGSVVSLAIRLAAKAEGGEILSGESTYRHTRRAFEFTPLPFKIEGSVDSVNAYKVDRLLPDPKKARGIEGLKSQLVGRNEELGVLRRAFSEVFRGRGQIVSIIGEAGVGKSRLVTELKEYLKNKSQKKNPKSKTQNPNSARDLSNSKPF